MGSVTPAFEVSREVDTVVGYNIYLFARLYDVSCGVGGCVAEDSFPCIFSSSSGAQSLGVINRSGEVFNYVVYWSVCH